MWIVRLALRRPLSVAVMALLMLVLGALSFALMNVDIFPQIDLPVVLVVWNYPGLSATDMERRVVLLSERAFSTTVNGIEHMESSSFSGIGMIKVYFHPGATVAGAIAQMNSVAQTNVIIPAGTAKIGDREYAVELNGSPLAAQDFDALPIKVVDGTPITLGDVAPVTNTHQVQSNVVRVDGKRATYLMIIKHAA